MRLEQPAIVQSISRLICTGCGAETNAMCNCGVEYKPKAVRAAEAIAAAPEKSNRAIAAEIGSDEKTVRKIRHKVSTADQSAVEMRTGLDGKTRKMPMPAPDQWEAGRVIGAVRTFYKDGVPMRQLECGTVSPINTDTWWLDKDANLWRSKLVDPPTPDDDYDFANRYVRKVAEATADAYNEFHGSDDEHFYLLDSSKQKLIEMLHYSANELTKLAQYIDETDFPPIDGSK